MEDKDSNSNKIKSYTIPQHYKIFLYKDVVVLSVQKTYFCARYWHDQCVVCKIISSMEWQNCLMHFFVALKMSKKSISQQSIKFIKTPWHDNILRITYWTDILQTLWMWDYIELELILKYAEKINRVGMCPNEKRTQMCNYCWINESWRHRSLTGGTNLLSSLCFYQIVGS